MSCPSRSTDGEACIVSGEHRLHFGPVDGNFRSNMWADGELRVLSHEESVRLIRGETRP